MNSKRMIGTVVAGITALTMASTYARSIHEVTNEQPGGGAAPVAANSQASIETAKQQAALINQIADKFQAEASSQFRGNFDALEWKLNFGARMMHQSTSALATALSANNLGAMQSGLVSVGTAKHTTDADQVITLLPNPCRIVDTRFGGGGMLGPAFRFWYAANTPAVIAAQGGAAAGCIGSTSQADSFLMYVTVVPPGAPLSGGANFLTVQHDAVGPTTATMNYVPGINIANFAVTACNGCSGGTGGFYAFASSPTHVVIDLVGIGGPPPGPLFASLLATGVISRGSRTTSSTLLGTGIYEVIFDRNITACAYTATIGNPGTGTAASGQISIQQRAGNANGVFVQTTDPAGAVASRPFYVTVDCP